VDFWRTSGRCNNPVSTPPAQPPRPSIEGPAAFSLAPALRARLLGTGLLAIGTVVLIGMLLTWLADLPTAVASGLVVLALVGVVVLALLVGRRHWVLRLDEHGYRVRGLRSGQASSARWTDVLDLQATTVAGQRCVVLRLRDGRTTTLPVDAIEGGSTTLVQALTDHLDRGHGYRRLR
jgi:hypothetical protein